VLKPMTPAPTMIAFMAADTRPASGARQAAASMQV
jgi:hypothetical protein